MVELGWPAKALSPNYRSRSHWPRTRAIKAARLEGFVAAKAALRANPLMLDGDRLSFVVTAYPPDKRIRDDDNVKSALKAARDGIAQALGVDDSRFDERFQWGEPVKHGKIVVVIGS